MQAKQVLSLALCATILLFISVATAQALMFSGSTPAEGALVTTDSVTVEVSSSSKLSGPHSVFVDSDDSLFLWVPMDSLQGGNPVDISGNDRAVTAAGNPTLSSGHYGQSLDFDAEDDILILTTPLTLSDTSTVSLWVKPNGGTDYYQALYEQDHVLGLFYMEDGTINFYYDGLDHFSTATLGTGWNHVVVSTDNGRMTYYINGVADESYDFAPDYSLIYIGSNPDLTESFQGSLDEFIVFNRALSASEVRSLYDASANQYSNTFNNLENGQHTFSAHATLSDGTTQFSPARTITVDAVVVPRPVITLLGQNPVTIQQGSLYVDAGATALDAEDGDVTSQIVVTSTVDTNVVGTYTVMYNVVDLDGNAALTATRTVSVVDAVVITQPPIHLGTAGNFVILSKSGISNTGTTSVVGNIGVSPIDSTAITGFDLALDDSTQFATSDVVIGNVYAADYSSPTPTMMTTAIGDMETAYTEAAGRTLPDHTELGAGDISEMTLTPGLYKWSTGVTIPTDVVLDCQGDENAVFVFQIAQDLTVGNGAVVTLDGDCQANNIFWQVGGQATVETTAVMEGTILSQTAIVIKTDAILNGRALAQTAVTLDGSALTIPTGVITDAAPVLTVLGDNPVTINLNSDYIDAGASASDAEDGDISEDIIVTSDVNTSLTGSYTVTYSVTDSFGTTVTMTRTVIVEHIQFITLTPENIQIVFARDFNENGKGNAADILKLTWDNSASGDNNANITSVTFDLSGAGNLLNEGLVSGKDDGEAQIQLPVCKDEVAGDGIWTACFRLHEPTEGMAAAVDGAVVSFDVIVTDTLDHTEQAQSGASIYIDNKVPELVSVMATSLTTIEIVFSEDVQDSITMDTFVVYRSVNDSLLTDQIAIASLTENHGIVILTLESSLATNDNPYVVINSPINDLGDNLYSEESVEVEVMDPLSIQTTHQNIITVAEQNITLMAGASNLFTGIESLTWDFGDGTDSMEGTSVTHTYTEDGIYTILVSATDNEGFVAEKSIMVVVGSASFVPLGAVDDELMIEFSNINLSNGFYNLNVQHVNVTTDGFTLGSTILDISSDLSNGLFSAILTLSYADQDEDGVVDGTTVNASSLVPYFYDGTQWIAIPVFEHDTDAKSVTFEVNHFTPFALMAVNPVAAQPPADNGGSSGGGSNRNSVGGSFTNRGTATSVNPTTTSSSDQSSSASGENPIDAPYDDSSAGDTQGLSTSTEDDQPRGLSRITGAVVGAVGGTATFLALLFLLVIIGLFIIVGLATRGKKDGDEAEY